MKTATAPVIDPVSESVDTAAIRGHFTVEITSTAEEFATKIRALVAEVDRLRAENTRLREVAKALIEAVARAYSQEGGE